jgi:hypothetical protein
VLKNHLQFVPYLASPLSHRHQELRVWPRVCPPVKVAACSHVLKRPAVPQRSDATSENKMESCNKSYGCMIIIVFWNNFFTQKGTNLSKNAWNKNFFAHLKLYFTHFYFIPRILLYFTHFYFISQISFNCLSCWKRLFLRQKKSTTFFHAQISRSGKGRVSDFSATRVRVEGVGLVKIGFSLLNWPFQQSFMGFDSICTSHKFKTQ